MTGQLLESPTDFSSFELTEWLETSMVLEEIDTISRAEIESRFPSNQRPDAAEIEELAATIRRRADTAPDLYPFRASDETIHVDPSVDPTIYRFLLVLAIEGAPYRYESRFNEINPGFELITREAGIAMYGAGGAGRRFGWPNDDGRPENLAEAVEWLAQEMGLGVGVVREDVDDDDKDGGVDVAVWRPFADGRPSFPVILFQCTVQGTFERKPADVVPEMWTAWIRFGKEPTIGLSIPFALPPDAKVRLSKLRYTAGVVFDRLRLCELLNGRDLSNYDEYRDIQDWTVREIDAVRRVLSRPEVDRSGKKTKPRMARRRRERKATAAKPEDAGSEA